MFYRVVSSPPGVRSGDERRKEAGGTWRGASKRERKEGKGLRGLFFFLALVTNCCGLGVMRFETRRERNRAGVKEGI